MPHRESLSRAADHDPSMTRRGNRYRIICRCGWVSQWLTSEQAAEADHDMHVRLSDA